ncbi:hypothetical protein FOMPIDRAFT_1056702 [Fomitopsis schrenkii]|uniref:sn-1-specific diacylglycerol lipase n=1 Tax=Fomitopsis schrenkii TaxID=2126942 RepID=S8F0S1_FOMSC|nr:hypothetical protein FOMPIDRAFT_1056702 [Fomitopsis schrenkii]
MARAMGAPGKPVHVAVRDALKRNRGYSLVMCGHSLGAGVAALLALMWANPYTRLTHQHSGLPRRRMVSAYCIAPPCLTSPALGKIAAKSGLIVSFVYSTDIVSRLSLGSVRDLTRCAAWLCKAEDAHGEGYSKVTKRALRWKAGTRRISGRKFPTLKLALSMRAKPSLPRPAPRCVDAWLHSAPSALASY